MDAFLVSVDNFRADYLNGVSPYDRINGENYLVVENERVCIMLTFCRHRVYGPHFSQISRQR